MLSKLLGFSKQHYALSQHDTYHWLQPLLYNVLIVLLFSLGLPANDPLLARLAPAALWIASLVALFLSTDRLFQYDYEEGALIQWMLIDNRLTQWVWAKVLVYWLFYALPLVILSPLLSVMMGFPLEHCWAVPLALLFGTMYVCFLSAFVCGCLLGFKKGGVLLPVLFVPLYAPTFIFGTMLLQQAAMGDPIGGPLALLVAMVMMGGLLFPALTAFVIRLSLSSQ